MLFNYTQAWYRETSDDTATATLQHAFVKVLQPLHPARRFAELPQIQQYDTQQQEERQPWCSSHRGRNELEDDHRGCP